MEPLNILKPIKFVNRKTPLTALVFDIDSQRYTSNDYPAYNWDIYGRCNCCRSESKRHAHVFDLENYELPSDSGNNQGNADAVTGAPNQVTGIMPEVSLEPAMESLEGLDYEEPPGGTDSTIAALLKAGFTRRLGRSLPIQAGSVASAGDICVGDTLRYKVSDKSKFTVAQVTMMDENRMKVGELVVFKRVFNAFEFEVYVPDSQSWVPAIYRP